MLQAKTNINDCNPSLPIGFTPSGNSVYFSPFTAIYNNLSSGTCVTGKPGRGKTNLIMKIASNALDAGQIFIGIDPKNDLQGLTAQYPDLRHVDIMQLSNTTLDPMFIGSMGATDIISFLNVLLPKKGAQIDTIIPIIQDFVKRRDRNREQLSLGDLTKFLYGHKSEVASDIGVALNLISEDKVGKNFFGNEGERPINITRESQIITLGALDLEAPEGTMIRSINAAVMYIVVYMLNKAMEMNTSKYPILVVIDEFKVASASEAIVNIVEKLLVLGRSLRIATIIASQNITHIPERLSGLFQSKFSFEMDIEECKIFSDRFVRGEFSKETISNNIENLPKYSMIMVDRARNISSVRSLLAA